MSTLSSYAEEQVAEFGVISPKPVRISLINVLLRELTLMCETLLMKLLKLGSVEGVHLGMIPKYSHTSQAGSFSVVC